MTIGTSNSTTLSYIKEVTAGTTPATPTMKLLRFTGESLESTNSTTSSEEIRDDRATSDLILTDQSNAGDINSEMSGGTFDDFIEAALMSDSDWTTVSETETTFAATATGFTDSGNGFVSAGLQVGQFISFSGFTASAINALKYRVVTLAAGVITTYPVPPSTESAGDSVTLKGSTVKSGKEDRFFTIQKAHTGVSPVVYQNFKGVRVAKMTQTLSVGGIAQIGFSFMGLTGEVTETQFTGYSATAKSTTELMNCVGDVTEITAVGTGITSALKFTDISFDYDNSLRELKAIGQLGSVDVRAGTIVANATINPYFENKQLLEAFLANESFTLSWVISGSDGYSYVFSLPRVKFTAQSLAAGSKDADMIINGSVQAILDAVSGTTMRVDRFTP